MTAVLELQNLAVSRQGRVVLDIDHLDIRENEVLAVIGPNGSGKSTLLLALSLLLKPDRGRVIYRGKPLLERDGLNYRRSIGLVLQDPLLLDTTVYNNVATGLRFRGLQKKQINRQVGHWIERLNISHLQKRRAGSLSGGEAQRASLARAFALNPDVLLLDEPFSALDAPTRAHLLDDFQAVISDISMTTVFITHDMNEALMLGDRVAVIIDGKLQQVGDPEVVFTEPANSDIAAFVGMETVISGKVAESRDGLIVVKKDGMELQAVSDAVPGRSVLLCLRPEDVTLRAGDSLPEGQSSARNQLQGRVVRIVPQGPLTRVVVDCGFNMVALVTRTSTQEMALRPGKAVEACFKASAIHVIAR